MPSEGLAEETPMNVLVIGGTRFIGRAIVEELLRHGHAVTVYHRGTHETEYSAPVTHVHGDRRDHPRFQRDLASLSPDALVDVIPMNADDTSAVVEAFRGRITRSVHISSGDVYAPGQAVLIPEDAPRQSSAPGEISAYGQKVRYSKVEMEDAVLAAQETGMFPATILRLPAVYGPRDPLAREWFFIKRVLDGRRRVAVPDQGLALFHRGYVDDVARAAVLALESPKALGQTYNVGHERVLTVRGIAELVAETMAHQWDIVSVPGERLPPTNPFAAPYHIVYDLARIREDLGYRESVSLREGMERTVAWFVENQPTSETWGLARYMTHDAFDYGAEDTAMRAAEEESEDRSSGRGA
jgi:nucleoside-diphosphate-sugar epimerase